MTKARRDPEIPAEHTGASSVSAWVVLAALAGTVWISAMLAALVPFANGRALAWFIAGP